MSPREVSVISCPRHGAWQGVRASGRVHRRDVLLPRGPTHRNCHRVRSRHRRPVHRGRRPRLPGRQRESRWSRPTVSTSWPRPAPHQLLSWSRKSTRSWWRVPWSSVCRWCAALPRPSSRSATVTRWTWTPTRKSSRSGDSPASRALAAPRRAGPAAGTPGAPALQRATAGRRSCASRPRMAEARSPHQRTRRHAHCSGCREPGRRWPAARSAGRRRRAALRRLRAVHCASDGLSRGSDRGWPNRGSGGFGRRTLGRGRCTDPGHHGGGARGRRGRHPALPSTGLPPAPMASWLSTG